MQERPHQSEWLLQFWTKSGKRQNRFSAFFTYTFKQGQNTKSDQINHFQDILYRYTFTMILNSIYSMDSGDGIHSILRKQKVFF